MIEITEDKLHGLAEHAEKMLRHGGKMMQCIDELMEESKGRMGERGEMDYRRGGYRMGGGRYGHGGYRDDDDDMDDDRMGERRGRRRGY